MQNKEHEKLCELVGIRGVALPMGCSCEEETCNHEHISCSDCEYSIPVVNVYPPLTANSILILEGLLAKYNGGFELIVDNDSSSFKYKYEVTESLQSNWTKIRQEALCNLLNTFITKNIINGDEVRTIINW